MHSVYIHLHLHLLMSPSVCFVSTCCECITEQCRRLSALLLIRPELCLEGARMMLVERHIGLGTLGAR